jgi:hypothetical protein
MLQGHQNQIPQPRPSQLERNDSIPQSPATQQKVVSRHPRILPQPPPVNQQIYHQQPNHSVNQNGSMQSTMNWRTPENVPQNSETVPGENVPRMNGIVEGDTVPATNESATENERTKMSFLLN